MAVPVHVLHSSRRPPTEVATIQNLSAGDRQAVRFRQIHKHHFASRSLLQNQITIAISVQICSADHIPAGGGEGGDGVVAKESCPVEAAEEIDSNLSGALVCGNHVKVAIAINVRHGAARPPAMKSRQRSAAEECTAAVVADFKSLAGLIGINQSPDARAIGFQYANQNPIFTATLG